MTVQEWLEEHEEELEDSFLLEPRDVYDQAILGIMRRCGQQPLIVYDRELIIEVLEANGSSYLEAVEWLEYNIEGCWVGACTPGIVTTVPRVSW